MGVKPENCYDDPSPESLHMILDSIEEEERILQDYKRKIQLWKSLPRLEFWELDELVDELGEVRKPVHEYGGYYPTSLILFDDI
eukprot:1281098-Pleurochrysis_carterae.AAC.1